MAKAYIRRGWEQLAVAKPLGPDFPAGVPGVDNPHSSGEAAVDEHVENPYVAQLGDPEEEDAISAGDVSVGDISCSMEFEEKEEEPEQIPQRENVGVIQPRRRRKCVTDAQMNIQK